MIRMSGYAINFDEAVNVGRHFEFADQTSFAAFVASGKMPYINFGEHDADAIGEVTHLHIDDYGVGFIAEVDDEVWKHIRWRVCEQDQRAAHSFCSVWMSSINHEHLALNGRDIRRIKSAVINHVTISDGSAKYQGTGVWPINADRLAHRLQRLADRWLDGYAEHLETERVAQAKAATRHAKPASTGAADVKRQAAAYEEHRQRVAHSIALGLRLGKHAYGRIGSIW